MATLKAVDPKLIAQRDSRRVAIAKLLVAAKAKLDLDDGYGATALSSSVYNGFDNLSLLLISSNAKLDTQTGVYIDGSGDISPVHRATKSPKVLQAMIKHGANVNVADTSGSTPLHWAVLARNVDSVKLLIEAGAKVVATDKEGRRPSYWCKTYGDLKFPGDAEKKQITKLLENAAKENRGRTKR
jgi:ankyrin repeat protein